MKANYAIEAGDVTVIRPFIYIREQQTKEFSMSCKLPIINENCPACFEQPKVLIRYLQNINVHCMYGDTLAAISRC